MEKKFLTKEDIPGYLIEEIVDDRIEYIKLRTKKELEELQTEHQSMRDDYEKWFKERTRDGYAHAVLTAIQFIGIIVVLFL